MALGAIGIHTGVARRRLMAIYTSRSSVGIGFMMAQVTVASDNATKLYTFKFKKAYNMPQIKNIYVTITNHVQMVGYREIVEINAKARGLAGFVFNDVDGSVKLMASGSDATINDFVEDLKAQRPDTVIEVMEIVEDIKLPSPFGRIVIDEMREISETLDKCNSILGEMDIKLDKLEMLDKLDSLDKLDKLDALDGISTKLDTLPERIAEALRR
jgi:acylphosphatase